MRRLALRRATAASRRPVRLVFYGLMRILRRLHELLAKTTSASRRTGQAPLAQAVSLQKEQASLVCPQARSLFIATIAYVR